MIKFCQHDLVRIRNSAEIAALNEGSTISRPPCIRNSDRLCSTAGIIQQKEFETGIVKILENRWTSMSVAEQESTHVFKIDTQNSSETTDSADMSLP